MLQLLRKLYEIVDVSKSGIIHDITSSDATPIPVAKVTIIYKNLRMLSNDFTIPAWIALSVNTLNRYQSLYDKVVIPLLDIVKPESQTFAIAEEIRKYLFDE